MRKSKFTDCQIMDAVKRVEAGFGVPDICREFVPPVSRQLCEVCKQRSLSTQVSTFCAACFASHKHLLHVKSTHTH
jgi:hypothetical protein